MNPMTSDTLGVEELIERLKANDADITWALSGDDLPPRYRGYFNATQKLLLEAASALLPKGVGRGGKEEDGGIKRQSVLVSNDQTEAEPSGVECHGLDTPERVCFYEQDFYPLSNFSAFAIEWELNARQGMGRFDTSEALYHWLKFSGQAQPKRVPTTDQWTIAAAIRAAPSAHEAFKIAERHKSHRRRDWDEIKVGLMRDIIRAKAAQHEYVRRKLLATGDRELVENSWRDDFWGWGPSRDGQNMLGRLWMEVRAELRQTKALSASPASPRSHDVSQDEPLPTGEAG